MGLALTALSPAPAPPASRGPGAYLRAAAQLVVDEIRRIIPAEGGQESLYGLMLDYPLREAKGLRPALCLATTRALGSPLERAVRTAAVLELYHNAFLIHDDIQDGSALRRGGPTLHRAHGVPIAINVGDAMLALTLSPLLENIQSIGLSRALRVLEAVGRMSQETVEGQALELDWVRRDVWDLEESDYVEMVIKKTGWYSFITPIATGAHVAGASAATVEALSAFARPLSVAFQIRDDVLNLEGALDHYGKEIAGDLWEGKRTVVLLHLIRVASPAEAAEARRILSLGRPDPDAADDAMPALLDELEAAGELGPTARQRIEARLRERGPGPVKTEADVRWLLDAIARHGSLSYASRVGARWGAAARAALEACSFLPDSIHRDFLYDLVDYVCERDR